MKESFEDHLQPSLPPQGGGRLPVVIARARALRKTMTKAEVELWPRLRMRQLHGWRFRRQASIGIYIADFLRHSPALIIEVDGAHHASQSKFDGDRDKFLRSEGFRVPRFWNNDVLMNIDGVPTSIAAAGHALQNPLPRAGEDLGGGEP